MNAEIICRISPEEEELARKREELAILQGELTDRELFLTSLRTELAAFERRYLREVGVLYAELDDWNAKIAELTADAEQTEQARTAAAEARARAEESHAAAHGEAAKTADFLPSPELKKLFREVVRQIHPDNAADEADRALRTRLMAEANLAYGCGDEDVLKKTLEEYRSSPESIKGEGVAADLQRVLRLIERIVKRLAQIESEVAELMSSEIALLMAKVDTAAAKGRNPLTEMANAVQHRIELARREYEGPSLKVRGR